MNTNTNSIPTYLHQCIQYLKTHLDTEYVDVEWQFITVWGCFTVSKCLKEPAILDVKPLNKWELLDGALIINAAIGWFIHLNNSYYMVISNTALPWYLHKKKIDLS